MWSDPIVEEVRKYRQEHAAKFNYDIEAIMRDIMESEKQRGGVLISVPPNKRKENEPEKSDIATKAA